jgi:hypothetical protein
MNDHKDEDRMKKDYDVNEFVDVLRSIADEIERQKTKHTHHSTQRFIFYANPWLTV